MLLKKKLFFCEIFLIILFLSSCSIFSKNNVNNTFEKKQNELKNLLQTSDLTDESRFSLINQMSQNYLAAEKYSNLILFLTDYVSKNQNDRYNAYWLLITAYAYMKSGNEPAAELYFERTIRNYDDLLIKDKSIHFLCLQNLLQLSTIPENRILYFTQLISQFPNKVNKTELFIRLALEYEKLGEWNQALKTYSDFLSQKDAEDIQIAGIPDAYSRARNLVDFNNSPKDWTFDSLDSLVTSVKRAISRYDYKTLDKYKAKVNFFAMSWRQDQDQENSLTNFEMRSFMLGNRIRYSSKLDDSTTPDEAFLRTWGWSTYVNVWYLYFRKVNFPVDPEIHGRWEWAGIYFGEKL